MELTQLRSLVTIVREGSFTAAAEKLFVTQPALSQQMKALEVELGVQIFERRGRRLTVTAPGELVLAHAEQMLAQMQHLHDELAALQGVAQGRMRVGTSDTVCLYLLPPVVQAFRQLHPAVEIHLTNRPSTEVVTLLVEGAIDFGIVTLPVSEAGVETAYLCDRPEVAICSPEHPLAQGATATLEQLAHYTLLLLEKGTTSRRLLDQLLRQTAQTPSIIELGSIEVIKRYVAIGLGIAVVPRLAVQEEVAASRLCVLALPWLPVRALGIVRRRSSYCTPAEQRFLAMLQDSLAADGQPQP